MTILETAVLAAREAAVILLDGFNKAEIREKEQVFDLVTESDIASQKRIKEIVLKAFPHHSFLGEEDEVKSSLNSDCLWIVDPLDGTNNYAQGIPHFSISIAYAEKGEVLAGVVYDPVRDEMFTAEKGKGSFLNGNSLSCSNREPLDHCVVATGFYYDRGNLMERTLETIKQLFYAPIRGLRRNGSAALDLCWTAAGRFDAYFEYQLSVWDFAAGLLIVQEAGGRVSECNGDEKGLECRNIASSNSCVYDDFINIIRKNA